ncbi:MULTISPECIES: DUF6264 family protein [unclassified Microbacterium]|uniref:DUF6264 family protein n=1 Tax=unclassified Microbacterium TaxID=2609290 RepID=UPI000AA103CB|nr:MULTISPECIES: DUF6264 family protein [unclassified Microbacterium]
MSAAEPRHDAPELSGGDDARKRPQYGEYATPEQQRAAIREPAPQASARMTHLPTPVTGPLPLPHPTTSAARPSRTADRIITFALLVYGLITVISGVPQLWNFTELAQTTLDLAGIDATFSNFAQGDLWGRIGAIVFVVGWMLTAVLSWRAVARGRLSWWIPLVGAIVTFLVVTVCVMVPLYSDPAIIAYITR